MDEDFKKRKLWIVLLVVVAVVSAWKVHQNFSHKILDIPLELKEISGMEIDKDGNLWGINDGANSTELHRIDSTGQITKSINIYNAENVDWEDMTQDDFGHFFIGDFGNNSNNRNRFIVYKIENPIDIWSKETEGEIILFKYGLQVPETPIPGTDQETQAFETNDEGNYDLEAFIFYQGRLYLFTKNHTKPFTGYTNLYRMEDYASNQKAEFISRFKTCLAGKFQCWVTSAAMSPNREKLALLGSSKIWIFTNWKGDDFFSGDLKTIDLGMITQKEAITFENDSVVLISDERFMGVGGNLYRYSID